MTTSNGRLTDSGIEVKPVYTAEDLPTDELELPGEFPYTRGPYATMYRGRPWTIRQYAGYGSAEETNERFRYLLEHGQTGISVPEPARRSVSPSATSRRFSGCSPTCRRSSTRLAC